jgi:alpha-glucan,water dikinase
MAVLVQEIVNADYAFVIHTTNPSSGDSSEIYAEVVKGLGETLVGAYPGRAMSFICKKDELDSPKVSISLVFLLYGVMLREYHAIWLQLD